MGSRCDGNRRGVRGVFNRIEVRGVVASEDISTKIAQAMQRHAKREVKHIGIAVKDGTVTLTGKVGSYAERAIARGAAWRMVQATCLRKRHWLYNPSSSTVC